MYANTYLHDCTLYDTVLRVGCCVYIVASFYYLTHASKYNMNNASVRIGCCVCAEIILLFNE